MEIKMKMKCNDYKKITRTEKTLSLTMHAKAMY